MKIRVVLTVVVLAVAISAHAQATRTWVSGVGDDANPCSRTAPCKTFAGAISKTQTGGQISVLDPGGYGTLTVTKSITIDGTGTLGSILASGTSGLIINAPGANVTIRAIQIDGGVTGLNGIRIIAAGSVTVENCIILNFQGSPGNGISVESGTRLRVVDTQIVTCLGNGILVAPTAATGTAIVALENVVASGNSSSGIELRNNTNASISRSSLTHNGQAGVLLVQSTAEGDFYNTVMSFNAYGIYSGSVGSSLARIYGCQITNNSVDGIHLGAGTIETAGNNTIRSNSGNQTPSSNIGQQ